MKLLVLGGTQFYGRQLVENALARGYDVTLFNRGCTAPGLFPEAEHLVGDRGYAVWHGNYYALEIMNRLGLAEGAVRVGIVHYNTEGEVDGLLRELARL